MERVELNKVLGYRKMLQLNQSEIAQRLGISTQAYGQKENKKVAFKDSEKIILLEIFRQAQPQLSIDDLFF